MSRDPLQPLAGLGEIRVWSLIITLMGDLARAPGETLPAAFLSRITGRLSVRPEAMRVALHRLRRDGWIESHREGRSSSYAFTPFGRAEAERAARRIYAPAPPPAAPWHLLLSAPAPKKARIEQAAAMRDGGYAVLSPGVYLGFGAAPDLPGFAAFSGTPAPAPDWLRDQLFPAPLRRDYQAFAHALAQVKAGAPGLADLPETDRIALRALVVHGWRRLVLRHPQLPPGFIPPDCPVEPCRTHVMALLRALPAEIA